MFSLGAIVVLPFVPLVTDRLGRRHATALGSLFTVIGASMQTGAENFGMFVASRLVIGLGVPLSIVAASSLIGGAIVAAGVTLGTFEMNSNWGWRIPSLLQVAPSALQIAFIYFVPESPRWLISKGRGDQAMAVIVKYHAEGDVMSEFAKAEYVQIEKTLELEKETANMGWAQLVATPGMRRRVLIGAFIGLATQWSGNGLTSHVLLIIFDVQNTTSIHTAYLVEIFPFEVRAKGLSVFQWFSRAALFFNQFVNPIGIANAGWKYYISYCVFLLFEVFFVYFLFPETHGRTLEELAFLYEDEKIVEQGRRVDKGIHERDMSRGTRVYRVAEEKKKVDETVRNQARADDVRKG
ncbi:hypothetical protein C0993_004616 [Termitomyces sp. T159_Od127]|nr:hypothetical protein C0993_004616 [Termitomyces sp. T159_Od127]